MVDADASIDVEMLASELPEDTVHDHGVSSSNAEFFATSANPVESDIGDDIDPELTTMQFDPPLAPSPRDPTVPVSALDQVLNERAVKRNGLAVIVPPVRKRWEYKVFEEDDPVDEILEEYDDAGFIEYLVLFSDGREDVVSAPPFTLTLVRLPLTQLSTHTFNYLSSSSLHPFSLLLPRFFDATTSTPFNPTLHDFPSTSSTKHFLPLFIIPNRLFISSIAIELRC